MSCSAKCCLLFCKALKGRKKFEWVKIAKKPLMKIIVVKELYQNLITFNSPKDNKVTISYSNPLIISVRIKKFLIKRILIDIGSLGNVVTLDMYEKLGMEKKDLLKVHHPLVRLGDKIVPIHSMTNLAIVIESDEFKR